MASWSSNWPSAHGYTVIWMLTIAVAECGSSIIHRAGALSSEIWNEQWLSMLSRKPTAFSSSISPMLKWKGILQKRECKCDCLSYKTKAMLSFPLCQYYREIVMWMKCVQGEISETRRRHRTSWNPEHSQYSSSYHKSQTPADKTKLSHDDKWITFIEKQ